MHMHHKGLSSIVEWVLLIHQLRQLSLLLLRQHVVALPLTWSRLVFFLDSRRFRRRRFPRPSQAGGVQRPPAHRAVDADAHDRLADQCQARDFFVVAGEDVVQIAGLEEWMVGMVSFGR